MTINSKKKNHIIDKIPPFIEQLKQRLLILSVATLGKFESSIQLEIQFYPDVEDK